MDNLESKKRDELQNLAQIYKNHPQLFARSTDREGPEMLSKYGICIPGQASLPPGYVKLWPQDFIVEEITHGNTITTIDWEEKETPKGEGDTIYATLVKGGLSTIEAIAELASTLRVEEKQIQFAGIKDKDALTAQRISLRKIPLDAILAVASPYFFLKDLQRGKGAIAKSGLEGNKFTILIRTTETYNPDGIEKNINTIAREGFWNYYYLQRFGTPRLINFYWGYLILKGQYKEAIAHYLSEGTVRELPYIRNLRELIKGYIDDWETISTIFEPFPVMFHNELKVIDYLKNNPTDYAGALGTIPEQITLWIYAFSSWLFNNRIASFLKTNSKVPEELPLFLSRDPKDWDYYRDFLDRMRIWPPPFENLRPFPAVQIRKNMIKTKEKIIFHKLQHVPEGIILSFSLPKGVYATTFLAHIFQLVSGVPPDGIKPEAVNIKKELGTAGADRTLDFFKNTLFAKTKNIFEDIHFE
jgi:TruD family tRNA pseudouridine synthase